MVDLDVQGEGVEEGEGRREERRLRWGVVVEGTLSTCTYGLEACKAM